MKNFRKPHRLKKKKSIFRNRFFWLGILILIIFGGVFYFILFHSFFRVREIKVSGNSFLAEDSAENRKFLLSEIEKTVGENVNQRFLFFSSQSIFLFNSKKVNDEILKKFPQIAELDLKRKLPDIISVNFKERKPEAVFCQETNCFFLDKKGVIFEFTVKEEGFAVLKKDTDKKMNLGEKIITEEELSKILKVESNLKNDLKILTQEILVISEARFNIKASDGFQIFFNFKEDLDWQIKKLRAVLEEEIPSEKWKKLEYIDVRFGNFAPYKYLD